MSSDLSVKSRLHTLCNTNFHGSNTNILMPQATVATICLGLLLQIAAVLATVDEHFHIIHHLYNAKLLLCRDNPLLD